MPLTWTTTAVGWRVGDRRRVVGKSDTALLLAVGVDVVVVRYELDTRWSFAPNAQIPQ
jgi:hypothetical protein